MRIRINVGDKCFIFYAQELKPPHTVFRLEEITPVGFLLADIDPQQQNDLFTAMSAAVKNHFHLYSHGGSHLPAVQISHTGSLLMGVRLEGCDVHNFSEVNTLSIPNKEKYWNKRLSSTYGETTSGMSTTVTPGNTISTSLSNVPSVYPTAAETQSPPSATAVSPSQSESRVSQNTRAAEKRAEQEALRVKYLHFFNGISKLNDNDFAHLILGNRVFTTITRGRNQLPPGEMTDLILQCRQHFQSLYQSEFAPWLDQAKSPQLNIKQEKKAYKKAMKQMAITMDFFNKIEAVKGPILPEGVSVSERFYCKAILKAKRKCVEVYRHEALELHTEGRLIVTLCNLLGGFLGSVIGAVIGFFAGTYLMGTLGSVVPVVGTVAGAGIGGAVGAVKGALAAGGTGAVVGSVVGKIVFGAFAGWGSKVASTALYFKYIDEDPVNEKFKKYSDANHAVFFAVKKRITPSYIIEPVPSIRPNEVAAIK